MLRMAFAFSGCLRHCVRYRTLSGNDSAGDASVIYVPCTKAAPHALFGGERRLGGGSNSGSAPKFSFGQTLMENHEQWMDLCALAAKEQDPAKLLALTQEIARLLERKEQRLKGQLPATDESSG